MIHFVHILTKQIVQTTQNFPTFAGSNHIFHINFKNLMQIAKTISLHDARGARDIMKLCLKKAKVIIINRKIIL